MSAKPDKFVMRRHSAGVGWRIHGQRTGPWGHIYAEMPIALVAELNGLRRREVLEQLDRQLKKVEIESFRVVGRTSRKITVAIKQRSGKTTLVKYRKEKKHK